VGNESWGGFIGENDFLSFLLVRESENFKNLVSRKARKGAKTLMFGKYYQVSSIQFQVSLI